MQTEFYSVLGPFPFVSLTEFRVRMRQDSDHVDKQKLDMAARSALVYQFTC